MLAAGPRRRDARAREARDSDSKREAAAGGSRPASAQLTCAAGAASALRTKERVCMRARLCARGVTAAGCRQERRADAGRRRADAGRMSLPSPARPSASFTASPGRAVHAGPATRRQPFTGPAAAPTPGS